MHSNGVYVLQSSVFKVSNEQLLFNFTIGTIFGENAGGDVDVINLCSQILNQNIIQKSNLDISVGRAFIWLAIIQFLPT